MVLILHQGVTILDAGIFHGTLDFCINQLGEFILQKKPKYSKQYQQKRFCYDDSSMNEKN